MTDLLNSETTSVETTTTAVDAIDAALAKAKRGRGRPKVVLTPEQEAEKAAAKEAKEAAKAERKAARAEKKAAKAAEREAARANRAAEKAAKKAFQVGQAVKIVTGELAGLLGTVEKCGRERVFINTGNKKPAYVYVKDVATA